MTSEPCERQMIPVSAPLHTGRMVLTPVDPLQAANRATIVAHLADIGLLGAPLDGAPDGFAIGDLFGALVGFTGCAVQFGGGEGPACAVGPWVRVLPTYDCPRLMWGRNTRPPRCPECGSALRNWRDLLAPPPRHGESPITAPKLHCNHCGETASAEHWRWGRHGGGGRSFVSIEEVFPGEAAPLPSLLAALAGLSVGPWQHFYVQD
jgi:hypothetical protein